MTRPRKIVVTGAGGLLGWHASARLHAGNCAARFRDAPLPYDWIALDRAAFNNPARLADALSGADAVLHFAGVNRGSDAEIEAGNIDAATRLAAAVRDSGSGPHIAYANTLHATSETSYGRSKRKAGDLLAAVGSPYTDLILSHVFGECARPFYNNVTATLCRQIIDGVEPSINPQGRVSLIQAGAAVQAAIEAVLNGRTGTIRPPWREMSVPELYEKLKGFHDAYATNRFPALADPFDIDLFNSYRVALYPDGFPHTLKLNSDSRGDLFEAAKGGSGGQTFLSWTKPGVARGNHFHLRKVERFLVLQGRAVIRIRKVLGHDVWTYGVDGARPQVVDIPTLHSHSIENVGDEPLLTLFWTNEVFDPAAPDTYFDPVLTRQPSQEGRK